MSVTRTRQRDKTKKLFQRCIRQCLSLPEQMTVSEWAEKYRILDESSALPGRWSNSITPYLSEIMDCFNDPYIHEITFVKSAQVGGTEALINALGWIITKNPSPTMIVYPTDDLAKDISNDKLKPAFKKTPEISERFYDGKSNETNLKFHNMNVYLRSGGSPSKLASKAIKYLLFDEIDKMAGATQKEANPVKLATERTKTFKHSRKIYKCSTPTVTSNYIWKSHKSAEVQKEYFAPCPHCGEYITLQWKQIKFIDDNEHELSVEERAKTAMYYCQDCGAAIEDRQKPLMLRKGIWKDVKKTCIGKAQSVSYHINALYSFFVTWEDCALEFLKSKDDPEDLQNFVNSWLAEPWEDTKLKADKDLVMERQAPEPAGTVPEWAEMITAGVDVQETSVYFDITAWGRGLTSQSIIHGQALSLDDIVPYMNAEYYNESGTPFIVMLALIDSGDQTEAVYDFCMNYDWAIPVKGDDGGGINHYRITKINRHGTVYDGQQLVICYGEKYKNMIATNLHRENGIGSCMVHADCDEEYAEQLTSEHKIAEGTGRNRKLVWRTKVSHGDNHFLDARVYSSCAADIMGVRALGLRANSDNTDVSKTQSHKNKQNSWING